MNERIRELSYEAQRYALNNTTGPDLAGINELWQEKFAELLVKECVEYYRSQIGETSEPHTKTLKHFGVK